MSANAAMKSQYEGSTQAAAGGKKGGEDPRPSTITIPVYFNENGFSESSYGGIVNDVLRFTNQSTSQTLTVYILEEDGQSESTQLLSLTSQVVVGAGNYVDKTINSYGKFLFSLAEPPQTPPGDPGGGPVVVIIVSS